MSATPTLDGLASRETAQRIMTGRQLVVAGVAVVTAIIVLAVDPHQALVAGIAVAMAFWVLFVGLRVTLWVAAGSHRYPKTTPARLRDRNLPTYSILVALHDEARVLPLLIEALKQLKYPRKKLQVLFLLEENDDATWTALRGLKLPQSFKGVAIPSGGPKTKPNALNVGLSLATGDYVVIYDAEDRPQPDQLLKAVAAFRSASPDIACFQARLAFWNRDSTWVTRLYWSEYVTHFEWVLPGAARLGIVPPLGGTSNHFRAEILRAVAIDPALLPFQNDYVGAWDPYNVTEDAELAGALTRRGYRIAMLDSTTWEEATAKLRYADKQRRRWLKGYAQTGLVYTRSPRTTIRQMGFTRWFFYVLIMLGTPLSLLLSPVFWSITAAYFLTHSTAIRELFPPVLYYLGTLVMVFGNVALFQQLVSACLKRGAYGSVKYLICVPFWWLFTSWSAYAMLVELVLRPHHWHKTQHGHDLSREEYVAANMPLAALGAKTPT
jgi:glycosyltransferase XagB